MGIIQPAAIQVQTDFSVVAKHRALVSQAKAGYADAAFEVAKLSSQGALQVTSCGTKRSSPMLVVNLCQRVLYAPVFRNTYEQEDHSAKTILDLISNDTIIEERRPLIVNARNVAVRQLDVF
jgi:hypothetical protein